MRIGDLVRACGNIGGISREFVPAGSRGRVVDAGWLSGTRVQFTVQGWTGPREVEIEVYPGEVEVTGTG